MSPILSAVRSLLSDDDLRSHMATRTVHHVPASGVIVPDEILTLDTIEKALARGVVPVSEIRVFGEYTALDLPRVGVVKNDMLRPLALRKLARQGGTVVINNAQMLSSELWDLACAAERWLDASVALGVVASFGRSGIELHYDRPDLLILQLGGSKTWSFFGPPVENSAIRLNSNDGDPPTEITGEQEMRPGDLLYVPSGLFHRCTPGEWSLHLGIIVTYPSGEDFARQLTERLVRAANSGQRIPGFLGEEAVAAAAEAIKTRMIALIEKTDAMAWYAQHRGHRARVERLNLMPGAIPAEGVAILNVTIPPVTSAEGKLRAASAAVSWTPVLGALIELLREGPHPVSALPGLLAPEHSEDEVTAALARLVDTGLVRIAHE